MTKIVRNRYDVTPGTVLETSSHDYFLVTEVTGIVVNLFNGKIQGIESLQEPLKHIMYQEIMW